MTVIDHLPPARRAGMHRTELVGERTQELTRPKGYVPGWNKVTPSDPIHQIAVAEERLATGLNPHSETPSIIRSLMPKRRSTFRSRMRAVWEWFTLSATGIFLAFVLAAGGIFAAKILIYLFQELISEYIQ